MVCSYKEYYQLIIKMQYKMKEIMKTDNGDVVLIGDYAQQTLQNNSNSRSSQPDFGLENNQNQ